MLPFKNKVLNNGHVLKSLNTDSLFILQLAIKRNNYDLQPPVT